MTGERRIEGLELELPDGWVLLPSPGERGDGWAQRLAGRVAVDAEDDVIGLLAGQLAEIAEAADALDDPRVHAAALVRDPGSPLVDAMLTLASHASTSAGEYIGEIAAAVDSSDGYLLAREIAAEVPAGSVRGAHLMLAHLDADDDGEAAALEERVALGIFPAGCPDMVEVVVVAHGAAAFEDMPAEVLEAVSGLRVVLGAGA